MRRNGVQVAGAEAEALSAPNGAAAASLAASDSELPVLSPALAPDSDPTSNPALDAVLRQGTPPAPKRRASRLPAQVQFPLVIVLSLSLSSLGYSFLNEWTHGELASIAKPLESNRKVAFLAAWRIFELAVGWYGDYDGYDLAALNLLSHGPPLYLVAAFYDISPWTAGACLAIDTLSSLVPFLLLRAPSGMHVASRLPVVPREIILDPTIQVTIVLLAGLIYGVAMLLAMKTYLSTILVLYFEGITRVQPILDTTFGMTLAGALMGVLGLASQLFIFTPSAASATDSEEVQKFDPVTATLGDTLRWNLWGFKARTKVAILRTGVVVFVTWVNTFLQCAMTIKGVETHGAVAYASTWAVAAMMTGIALDAVGDADG